MNIAVGPSSTSSDRPGARRAFAVALALVSGLASAQQRFDHQGSLGLTVATGGEYVTAITTMATGERGVRIPIELGVTISLTNRTELRVSGRFAPGFPPLTTLGGSGYAGIRNSFGFEQWKTFFDLEAAVHFAPLLAFGARAAFGVQYDFSPIMGVYAQVGAQLGGASALRLSFEGMVGVQFRTYVFE
ncbi:MAG TPA: hypothetical protein VGD87_05195 [Archangium sp.]